MKKVILLSLIAVLQTSLHSQASSYSNSISIGQIIEIESAVLGESRQIFIHKPSGLWGLDEEMSNLPVIFVLDGETQFLQTVATVDFLSAAPYGNDLMPRSIVVGIPNTNRIRDLTPIKGVLANDPNTLELTGGGSKFLDFITQELIPYIDANYKTSTHRTIIGHSLGGLLTLEALLRKRQYFDNYITIDPGLGFAEEAFMRELVDTLQTADLSLENVYYSSGNTRPSFLAKSDLLSDTSDIMKLMDIANSKFISTSAESQWKVNLTLKEYPDENHFSLPQRATYDGLKKLYDYYPFPEILDYYHPSYKDRTNLVDQLKAHYQDISSKMGIEVHPLEAYLYSFAHGIAPSGREDLAIALFKYNIELHPNKAIFHSHLGSFYRSIGQQEKALEAYQKSLALEDDASTLAIIEELQEQVSNSKK